MKKSFSLILFVTAAIWLAPQTLPAQGPIVTIAATTPKASEDGPVPGVFTITCAGMPAPTYPPSPTTGYRIFYQIGGTAENGVDYYRISNSVVIPYPRDVIFPATASARVVINPILDNLVEGDETVELTLLSTPLNVGPPYAIGFPSSAVVTIADSAIAPTNWPPTVSLFSPTNGSIFTPPADITLIAEAQDSDGYVDTVEFFANGTSLGITTNNPLSMSPVNPFQVLWGKVPAGAYTLTAVARDNVGASTTSRPIQIFVGEPIAIVNIVATDAEASEIPVVPPGMGIAQRWDPARFTVTRDGSTSTALTVYYGVSGTAINGQDYTLLPGSVMIPAGETSAEIIVNAIDDNLVEGTETVVVTLHAPACIATFPPPPDCYRVGPSNQAKAVILDNDTNQVPVVSIEATDPEASETGPDTGTFTVSRTGGTDLALRVYYYTGGTAQNGIDYLRLSNYVVIPAGAASADIVVTPIDDYLVEARETVLVQLRPAMLPYSYDIGAVTRDLTNPIILPPPYVVGTPSNAVVTIADNDLGGTNLPPLVKIIRPMDGMIFSPPANIGILADARDLDGSIQSVEFFEGRNSLGFGMNMPQNSTPLGGWFLMWSNVPAGTYILTAKATDNQDATAISMPVRVLVMAPNPPPPPPTNTIPIVSIMAIDSVAAEGRLDFPTTVIVQSNVMSGSAAGYSTTSCWTRLDPTTTNGPYWTNVYCGTNTATFQVRRCGGTNLDLTVYYAIAGTASNGVDYVALPGSVTIPAGRRAANIVIVPIDDQEVEPIETVVLALTLPPDATLGAAIPYLIGTPSRAAALLLDNDYPPPGTTPLPDGLFHVYLPAATGTGFRLETSSDLVHWTACQTNIVTGTGVHYVDPDSSTAKMRFYRLEPEPAIALTE